MSKKKQQHKTVQQAISSPVEKKEVANASGLNSMTNWLLVLAALLPILYSRETMDPVISIRYLFLNGFVFVFLLYFFVIKKHRLGFDLPLLVKIVFLAAMAFTAWSSISVFYAANKATGYYEVGRYLGYILLLFIVMVTVLKEGSQFLKLCKMLTAMALLHSVVGIFQYYDLGFTEIPGFYPPYGFMANRNFFGSAQALLLPFILFTIYKGSVSWKYASAFTFLVLIISLLLSQTRSAWLSAFVVMFVSIVLVILFVGQERKKWIVGGLIAAVTIALLAIVLVQSDKGGSLSQSVQERFESLTGQKADSSVAALNVSDRFKMWNRSIEMIKDFPVFGVGPDNWRIAILAYNPSEMSWGDGSYVPDKPHNVYLQMASETGIPGAVFYFGVWILLALIGFKIVAKRSIPVDQRIVVILMLAGLAAFATDSMFSFPIDRPEHSLYLILTGGAILGVYTNAIKSEKTAAGRSINKTWLIFFFAICVFNLVVGVKKFKFEKHIRNAYAFDQLKDYQAVLEEVKAGKSGLATISPYGTPLELYSSLAYKELGDLGKAIEEANIARSYYPTNPKVFNNMGTIYSKMQQYDKAILSFKRALQFAPKFKIPIRNLAEIYLYQGNYAACIEILGHTNIDSDEYLKGILANAQGRLAAEKK